MKNILCSRRGLSITEVLVASAILGIIAVAISSISVFLKTNSQQYLAISESSEFVRAISSWLVTTDACNSSIAGRTLPSTPTALILNGFKGYGSQSSSPIQAGTSVSLQLRVKSLDYFAKNSVPVTPFLYNGVNLNRTVMIVSLSTETDVKPGSPRQLKTYNLEIPVLIDAGNIIRYCLADFNQEQFCAAQGGTINPVTGKCLTQTSCEITGSYSLPASSPASQCCGFSADPNPVTGAASCPAGSTAQKVGRTNPTSWRTYSCGKKCSAPIDDWKEFYVCLRCGS